MERSRYLQLRREYEPDNLTLLMWRCLLLSPVCIFTIRLPELARHISTLPISSFRPRADFRSSDERTLQTESAGLQAAISDQRTAANSIFISVT
jgi:hypothetical protein